MARAFRAGDRWNAWFASYTQGVREAGDHAVKADDEQELDELVVFVAFGEGLPCRVGQSVLRRQLVGRTEQQRILGGPLKVGVSDGEGQLAVEAGRFPLQDVMAEVVVGAGTVTGPQREEFSIPGRQRVLSVRNVPVKTVNRFSSLGWWAIVLAALNGLVLAALNGFPAYVQPLGRIWGTSVVGYLTGSMRGFMLAAVLLGRTRDWLAPARSSTGHRPAHGPNQCARSDHVPIGPLVDGSRVVRKSAPRPGSPPTLQSGLTPSSRDPPFRASRGPTGRPAGQWYMLPPAR